MKKMALQSAGMSDKLHTTPAATTTTTVPGSTTSSSAEKRRAKSPRPRDRVGGGGVDAPTAVAGSPGGTNHHHDEQHTELLNATSSSTSNGGGSLSDAAPDEVDGAEIDPNSHDPQRHAATLEKLNAKLQKVMDMIRDEQQEKEDNVNEYLRQTTGVITEDRQLRMKTQFEKRNQKSSQTISQLHRKLEVYKKRRHDMDALTASGGVTGAAHKPAKEVLRDVGHGLRGVGTNIKEGISGFSGGVVDNLRGAKETIVAKPKDFVQLIKNKFGSADNINLIKSTEDEGSVEGEQNGHQASNTLPAGFRYRSDDELSSLTSGSGLRPAATTTSEQPLEAPAVDLGPLLAELRETQESMVHLQRRLDNMQGQLSQEQRSHEQVLEEERFRTERLEEQINDLIDLHQHEVTNIKQELTSMEEKMEYQLEERTRDMQDALETCQTRITKMELQQQQLVSTEGFDNTPLQALPTKLINVVLAVLAVILICVSTVANFLSPFLTTRLRILSTIGLVATIAILWQNADSLKPLVRDLFHRKH